jgi:hypothetical protein
LVIACVLTWEFLNYRRSHPEVDFLQISDPLTESFLVFCVSLFGLIVFLMCFSAFLMIHLYPIYKTHFKNGNK